jgi:nitrilase
MLDEMLKHLKLINERYNMANRVAAIQMTSAHDVTQNLLSAEKLIQRAVDQDAKLIVLPEMFAIMGLDQMDKVKYRETIDHGRIQDFLREQALKHNIFLIGGTIPIAASLDSNKVYAACLVFNGQGQRIARYDKIHLFDVEIREQNEKYSESHTTLPGNDVVVVDTPFGKLGLAVCYDIRFPELFRMMHIREVEIIAFPAAFTFITGSAHWDILVRARAIENQVYIIAAAQTGIHSNQRKTYGHSMIVNPWGNVQAALPKEEGIVVADVDLNDLHRIRGDFPTLKHRKLS